jgi:hypothetical protein
MNRLLIIFLSFSLSLNAQLCDPNTHCLLFDGQSWVSFTTNNDLNISDEITIEAWIYPTSWGLHSYSNSIVCKHGWTLGEEGYVLRAGGNGQLSFNIFGLKNNGHPDGWHEVISSAGSLQLNAWTHVAGTFDGSKLRIYINGTLSGTENFHGSILTSGNYKLKIGKISDDGAANGRYWNGLIDEIRIWDEARSQSEISSSMDNHVNPNAVSDLEGYWQLNDGNGSSINDLGDGNNAGTIHSASWNTDVPFSNGIVEPTVSDNGGNLISSSLYGNQWNLNGVPIPGETGITFTPLTSGTYSLTVNFGLGCIATSDPLIISLTGINDLSEKFAISYFISEKVINFTSFPMELLKSNVSLFDMEGRSLKENEKFTDQINLATLPAGLYVLYIHSDEINYKRKIVLY